MHRGAGLEIPRGLALAQLPDVGSSHHDFGDRDEDPDDALFFERVLQARRHALTPFDGWLQVHPIRFLADVQIDEYSRYVGKRLMETDLRELGVIVVGIRRRSGERLLPPPGNAMIEAGDCLFAFGSTAAVNRMIGTSGHDDE
ncbi:MAG: hypothetical protein EHM42_00425 [Planctomycetaceae bacterium]|nr:MAG: hypothetical protein EHM42_00425 [Planctomycetaceae bacterium]